MEANSASPYPWDKRQVQIALKYFHSQLSILCLTGGSRRDRASCSDTEVLLRLLQTHLVDQVADDVVNDLLPVPLSEWLRLRTVARWEPERLVELELCCAASIR